MQTGGQQSRYRIVVRGSLSERLAQAFEGMEIERVASDTAIIGEIADQAVLFGVIERVRDLGLDLVRVVAMA